MTTTDQMHNANWSRLARKVADLHPDKLRTAPVWGACVHMCGRSIVEQAMRAKREILNYIVAYYQIAAYSCHYVIGYDGEIVQVAGDDRRVPHIGVSADERRQYLDGTWMRKIPLASLNRWRAHWSPSRSPQHLFPSGTPNSDYVGIELVPLLKPSTARNHLGLGHSRVEPETFHAWHTDAQHRAVAQLANDLRERHGWPPWVANSAGIKLPQPRLLGHEDLDAFGRWDNYGGWDPGALRAQPRFSWGAVSTYLDIPR